MIYDFLTLVSLYIIKEKSTRLENITFTELILFL